MVMTPASAAAASTRKSIKEIQFEMMKEGLDLTHAFKFAEAEQVYTELIALFGPSPGEHEKQVLAKAYSNRGNVRSMLDRVSDALVDYSKALDLASDQAEYWVNRGLAFESLADELLATRENDAAQFYEASMGDYDHAIILDPENHRLYLNAGDVLCHLRRHDAALEYYRRALALMPTSPANRGKVALLELENGNVQRGAYLLETITRRNPDFAEMLLASAALDWTLGRFVEGIDTYSTAISRDPRLLDDDYLEMQCHWPPTMMKMVGRLREAGTMEGIRSTAVSWFDSPGSLI